MADFMAMLNSIMKCSKESDRKLTVTRTNDQIVIVSNGKDKLMMFENVDTADWTILNKVICHLCSTSRLDKIESLTFSL